MKLDLFLELILDSSLCLTVILFQQFGMQPEIQQNRITSVCSASYISYQCDTARMLQCHCC